MLLSIENVNNQKEFLYKYNNLVGKVSSAIMFLTNMFWLILSTITGNKYDVMSNIVIASMSFICILVFCLASKNSMHPLLMRITYVIFCMGICAEVLMLNLNVPETESPGDKGITLVTLYLITIVFFAFEHLIDKIAITTFEIITLVVPEFTSVSDRYSLPQYLVLVFSFIFVGIIFGYIVRKLGTYIISTKENETRFKILSEESVETIANTIDAKDKFTKGHSKRVAIYARELGKVIGFDEAKQREIYHAGLLHDIGKTTIPDNVLSKPSSLTTEEYNIIKTHSQNGYNILKNLSEIPYVAIAALQHHERIDGKGYPNAICGDEIDLYARIISIADTYDAMTHKRAYRNELPLEKVMSELTNAKGTQLDWDLTEKFIELINNGSLPNCDENGEII